MSQRNFPPQVDPSPHGARDPDLSTTYALTGPEAKSTAPAVARPLPLPSAGSPSLYTLEVRILRQAAFGFSEHIRYSIRGAPGVCLPAKERA
jgi:hypothetical protein